MPPGCSSEKPDTIQDFITKAKAALVSVGIVRDTVLGNNLSASERSKKIVIQLSVYILKMYYESLTCFVKKIFILLPFFAIGNGKFSGRIVDSDMHDVGRFLNRLLGLPPDIQNRYTAC